MTAHTICPFYGKGEDSCEVGCGYISVYDVSLIIRYCSRSYRECYKYQELADPHRQALFARDCPSVAADKYALT